MHTYGYQKQADCIAGCCKPSTMLQATLLPTDVMVTRSSIGVSPTSPPLGVHEIIGLANGPIYVALYPGLPQQIFLCPWTHYQGPLPSPAAPRKPPSMPCLMTKVYVGCDITDKSPIPWHTDSPINSALSQETTMLCMYVCQPLSPSLFHRDSPLPTGTKKVRP